MSSTFAKTSRRAIDTWCASYAALSREIAASPVLRASDKIVFAVLAGYLFKSTKARGIFPALDKLAADCGLSVERVEKSLHRLRYGRSNVRLCSPRNGWVPLVSWVVLDGRRYYRVHEPSPVTRKQLGR